MLLLLVLDELAAAELELLLLLFRLLLVLMLLLVLTRTELLLLGLLLPCCLNLKLVDAEIFEGGLGPLVGPLLLADELLPPPEDDRIKAHPKPILLIE